MWLTLLLAAVTMLLTPITINAGGWLYGLTTNPSPILRQHAERGSLMSYFSAGLLAVAVLLVVVGVIERRSGKSHVASRVLVAILVLAVGISSMVQIYRVGDAGAQSVWGTAIAHLTKNPTG
jgi:hypothetical protein